MEAQNPDHRAGGDGVSVANGQPSAGPKGVNAAPAGANGSHDAPNDLRRGLLGLNAVEELGQAGLGLERTDHLGLHTTSLINQLTEGQPSAKKKGDDPSIIALVFANVLGKRLEICAPDVTQ